MSSKIEKAKKYYLKFYEEYDKLPFDLKQKLMEQETMPTIVDIQNIYEEKEIEDLFQNWK